MTVVRPSADRRAEHIPQPPTALVLERLFVGDVASAADMLVERALSRLGGYACLANAHVLATARHDLALEQALADATLVFPDGFPVAWLLRRLGKAGAARVAGPDLMPAVVEKGQAAGLRHFLFGSTEAVLARVEETLRLRYPAVEIVGRLSPGFGDGVSRPIDGSTRGMIRSARPHVVWCALGAPKQELWMQRNVAALTPSLLVGVGAAFDFVAGTKRRAPLWLQGSSLEWLHRFASEPRRLGPRYLRTIPSFLLLAARELARARMRRGCAMSRSASLPESTRRDA